MDNFSNSRAGLSPTIRLPKIVQMDSDGSNNYYQAPTPSARTTRNGSPTPTAFIPGSPSLRATAASTIPGSPSRRASASPTSIRAGSPNAKVTRRTSTLLSLNGVKSLVKDSSQVICVAGNYIDHCNELNRPIPAKPNFFFKSPSTIIFPPESIKIPRRQEARSIHYEVELAVVIGKRCVNVPVEDVPEHIAGVTVALDITARDVQEYEKSNRLSWFQSKNLRTFCPLCPDLIFVFDPENLQEMNLVLSQNGKIQQDGNTCDMIFKVTEIISYLSSMIDLHLGDIVLTGTPAGAGELEVGDLLNISIGNENGIISQSKFEVALQSHRPDGVTFYPYTV